MANILYLSFSLVYVFMIGYAWRLTDQKDLQYRFYLLILAALFYDNFVSGIGFAIGAGPFLKFINFFRFAFHAFITPLLCYVVFKISQKMQVAIAQSVIAEGVVWVMIVAFMISGYMHDIAPMDFVPQVKWGVLNYTHSQSSIPLPVILINVFVLGMAILIWKKIGWPGLFLVSICMFCIAAIPVRKVGLLPGNAGEIILAYGFLLAQKKVLVSST